MSPAERLLSLAVRIPAVLLPFAAALGLAETGILSALGAAAAALGGYWLAQQLWPWALKRIQSSHALLCTAAVFAGFSVLLIVAVEQQALWTTVLLSGFAGLAAPPERSIIPNRRLQRTAVGSGFLLALLCGAVAAWSVPLVATAFLAATATPVLVSSRTQLPKNSATADL